MNPAFAVKESFTLDEEGNHPTGPEALHLSTAPDNIFSRLVICMDSRGPSKRY